jgi:hypothetical protein
MQRTFCSGADLHSSNRAPQPWLGDAAGGAEALKIASEFRPENRISRHRHAFAKRLWGGASLKDTRVATIFRNVMFTTISRRHQIELQLYLAKPPAQGATVERPTHLNNTFHPAEGRSSHDLERQLSLAEQRYAAARDVGSNARAELRELMSGKAVSPHLLESARMRLDAVTARCRRLRSLIDDLEERLDI